MKTICVLTISVLLLVTSSCAAILRGGKQDIPISSNPAGAKVTINGMNHGTTPTIVNLVRRNNYVVKLELDGFLPFETTLVGKVDAIILLDLVFLPSGAGIIFLFVDAATGSLHSIKPIQVTADLKEKEE